MAREVQPERRQTEPRRCPVCQESLAQSTIQYVTVDVCAQHGIWLDKGEFEALQLARADRQGRRARMLRESNAREAKWSRIDASALGAVLGWFGVLLCAITQDSGGRRRRVDRTKTRTRGDDAGRRNPRSNQ